MTFAVLPSPDLAGADFLERVHPPSTELHVVRHFDSVALLLDDTTMAYGSDGRMVMAGNVIEAGGHRYEVAVLGSSGAHLMATSAGILLKVLPGADGTYSVQAFGAKGDAVTNDSPAFQKIVSLALALGTPVTATGQAGANYRLFAPVTMAVNGLRFDLCSATVQTVGDIVAFEVGAPPGSSSSYGHSGVCNARFLGSGVAYTSNRALVVRNHSYGRFDDNSCTGFGAKPILIHSNARGVQYNSFRDWEVTYNHDGALEVDTGSMAGGYINDNLFDNIRAHKNPPSSGSHTHVVLKGSLEMQGNRFLNCGFETQIASDTILDMQNGTSNLFWGLRLDGDNASVALKIAAGCNANWFLLQGQQGMIQDRSGTTVYFGDRGSSDLPFIQFGTAEDPSFSANNAFFMGLQQPGSSREFHMKSILAGGAYRFPAGTQVFFGDRAGDENGALEWLGNSSPLKLQFLTQNDVMLGSGPCLTFRDAKTSVQFTLQQTPLGLDLMSGSTVALRVGSESHTYLPNATYLRPLHIQNVQLWSDSLGRLWINTADPASATDGVLLQTNQNGSLGNRPGSPMTGMQYFDTTLGKPIWYNGTGWVDALGTSV